MNWAGPIKQRNIDVPEGLYNEFKATAARRGKHLKAAVPEALEEWIGKSGTPNSARQEGAFADSVVDHIARILTAPESELDELEIAFRTYARELYARHLAKQKRKKQIG